ncbi:PREDICTED: odorant receptor 22c-like [Polistes dominula]|uniref:Odorant receptor n=1 Tax=Polistes dominula TaxID=743375 RepID=A0ABM1ILU1_POLDO|nr:PREDICTED: odorant receptor 22c-like [Polistes dominula]
MSADSFGKNVISVNLFLLKFSGIIPCKTTLFFNIDWTNLLAIIAFFSLTTYSVTYTYEFVKIVNTIHVDIALEFFSMIISLISGQARYIILWIKREQFLRMLNVCENLWIELDKSEKHFVHENNPNETVQRNLPYAFIIEVHESPYFEIAYVFQLSSMINVGLTCVGVDTVGPVLILIACGHLKVIQNKMLSLNENMKSEFIEDKDFVDFHQSIVLKDVQIKLNNCVNYHITILEFCKNIEELTNIMFLTQLIGSTYNISLVGFKLAGNDPDKYKYTTQVLIAVIQLFLCNWPPDVLLFETAAIANSSYSVPWYNYSTKLRRSINIIIMRSQRAVRLTAGKFTSLSLETFASMISTAASFFTVISSMN